ncbi:MAG: 3-hydroxyacyl-CoA dehydrogenase NAD-binding domain-containing protein [Desulfarculaceae bacterium]|jgi:3-hydroxyacyl-CoA dehydrogenase
MVKAKHEIKRVGIVGGGTMGSGLARYFLGAGLAVTLIEADEKLAQRVEQKIKKAYANDLKKQKRPEDSPPDLRVSSEARQLEGSDLVIEAVPEDLDLKKSVLRAVEATLGDDAVMGSNTSSLPVSALAACLARPSRFLGTHFFNPAQVMPLVEVVPGLDTDPGVAIKMVDFLSSTGKKPVLLKECPGFLVNRILGAYMNEVMWVLQDRAGIQDVETSAKELGMPMGPATLGDMVGWDVIHASNRILAQYYGGRFSLPPLLVKLVDSKRYGIKTGKGFFDHSSDSPVVTDDLAPVSRAAGKDIIESVKERLLLAIIAESLRCLEERVATPDSLDMAMVTGAGFAKGPIAWADELGLESVLDKLQSFSVKLGRRFWPSPILQIHVLAGFTGKEAGRGLKGFY